MDAQINERAFIENGRVFKDAYLFRQIFRTQLI